MFLTGQLFVSCPLLFTLFLSHTHRVVVVRRESRLTRLLQDSIGGNSRTFLIATLSPSMSALHAPLLPPLAPLAPLPAFTCLSLFSLLITVPMWKNQSQLSSLLIVQNK
jgi:hypothetical protein